MASAILLVKMSSLGDVIHAFPAVTDIKRANPAAHLVWAVEEAYTPLVALHAGVDEILPVPLRRLRQTRRTWLFSQAWRDFQRSLRARSFAEVIDGQGLLKSALITALARAPQKSGFAWNSAREPLASLFYRQRIPVAREQHAILRLRQLCAAAGHYSPPPALDFGLRPLTPPARAARPYLLFFHGTTWASKMLPVATWQGLRQKATAAGYEVFLPWGNAQEKSTAEAIGDHQPQSHLLPPLTLPELAQWIAGSAGVVSVDTGLGHLAGALGVPVLGVFAATDPVRSGILGANSANIGKISPCYRKDCRQHGAESANACMQTHDSATLWQRWQALTEK